MPEACQLYDPEPSHLWNRLHCLFHLRVGPNGTFYGLDELDTLHWANSRHLIDSPSYDRASALLDEFAATSGERLIDDPVRRAILQRDLWAIFDWLDTGIRIGSENSQPYDELRRKQLQSRLAAVMRQIALSRRQIAELPDNYVQAVRSGDYAPTVQLSDLGPPRAPGAPSPPYLPADLFAPNSPWLLVGGRGSPLAELHIQTDIGGRSVWLVLVRVPESRARAEAFVSALAAPDSLDRPPELIAGTELALMRRMLLVDDQGEVVPSPLTESVQLRRYASQATEGQAFAKFNLDRTRLFGGTGGGLRAVGPLDETFNFLNPGADDPFETDAYWPEGFRGSPVLAECHNCHASPGARSIQSYSREVSGAGPLPRGLVASTVAEEAAIMAAWKVRQPEWESLARLWR